MPYSINALDLIEIQVIGRHDGQRTRTVFHYAPFNVPVPIPNGQVELLTLLSNFCLVQYDNYVQCVTEDWTCELLQVQRVSPIRMRAIQKTPGDLGVSITGGIPAPSDPSGVAGRISLTTLHAGREYQGGHWLPGMPTAWAVASKLSNLAKVAYQTLADSLVEQIQGQPGNFYTPVIAHRLLRPLIGFATVDANDIIDQAVVRPEIRYQRRREIGKGE